MPAPVNVHTSIIIPTRNECAMLQQLVEGLIVTACVFSYPLELIVVDNNSDEPDSLEYLQSLENIQASPFASVKVLRYRRKFNFSAINNVAAKHSAGEFLCLLNNDVEIINSSWLTELGKPMSQSNTGCVGAMLYYPDDTIQHAGVYLDPRKVAGHLHKHLPRGESDENNFIASEQVVSAVTAACMLIRKSVYDEVGGFNESLSVAFNDVDLCLKVQKAGYQNIWTPHAQLYHHESKSRGRSDQRNMLAKLNHKKEVFFMKRRWRTMLSQEPHSNGHETTKKSAP